MKDNQRRERNLILRYGETDNPLKGDKIGKHWTEYTLNVTSKQAYALDKQADANGCCNGLDWLARCNGVSASKMTKILNNAVSARSAIDKAFKAAK